MLAFLSFFLNAYNIATGVLIYIAQCFVIGGGLVGANVYFKSKWIEFNTHAEKEIQKEIERRFKDACNKLYIPTTVALNGNTDILSNLYIQERNFYDEKDEPEKCDSVIGEILKYLGFQMLQ